MTQATPVTQKQLAYLAYWQQRGYQFKRGDAIPESTMVRPGQLATRRPFLDAVAGSAILAVFIVSVCVMVFKVGAGI